MKYGRYDRRNFRDPGEERALAFLESRGHILLRHNYHVRFGEIDLITAVPDEGFRLHASEVKAWSGDSQAPFVHPLQALNARKRGVMRRVMESFRLHASAGAGDLFSIARTASASGERPNSPEPALILARAGCTLPLNELDVCFDLVWVHADGVCEYFPDLF